MRVLVVSHNVFCQTTNMGKTMISYFHQFGAEEVAQFYVHSEIPTEDTVCRNYYRFTDREAVLSILRLKRYGTRLDEKDIRPGESGSRTDTGMTHKLYRVGTRRTASIYALRDMLWKMSRWATPEFWTWVEQFRPDVIFLMSGDYGFIYDIARTIADRLGRPLVTVCVDDHYCCNRNGDSLLGRLVHRRFMRTVHKTMDRSSEIFTICQSMADVYADMFHKPCRVLHTAAEDRKLEFAPDAQSIAYVGNMVYGRHSQLVDMGRALRPLGKWIDVYSMEDDPQVLALLTEENGIRFHGPISAQQVLEVMSRCAVVIHTESFDEKMKEIVRFSVSTKVAGALMYGPCLVAYGPEDVASIRYLRDTGAAYTICSREALPEAMERILSDHDLRREIVERARQVASENHRADAVSQKVRQWLTEICQTLPL